MKQQDRDRLNKEGGVKLNNGNVANLTRLVEWLTAPPPDKPGWSQNSWMRDVPIQQQESKRRQIMVEHLHQIWRDAGGKGHGAGIYALEDPLKQGPLIRFIIEFLRQNEEALRRAGRTVEFIKTQPRKSEIKTPTPTTLRRHVLKFRKQGSPTYNL